MLLADIKPLLFRLFTIYAQGLNMIIIRIAFLVSCLSAVILLFGCTPNMVTTPDIAVIPYGDFSLGGEIDYDGNKEYLPRTVTADASLGHPLILRYRYEVTYDGVAVPSLITYISPLTTFVFPISVDTVVVTGADTVVVAGKLEILKGGSVVKTYSAECMLDKTRTIFSEGETLSEIRKRGLLAVRDSIEAQMYADQDMLRDIDKQLTDNKKEGKS
jgi:hypothetical protein